MRFRAFPEYLTSANYLISLGLSLLSCLLELLTEVDQLGEQQRFRVWGVVLTQENGGCSHSLLPLDGLSNHFLSLCCMLPDARSLSCILKSYQYAQEVGVGGIVSFSFIYSRAPVLGECTFIMSFWSVDHSVLASCTWPRVCVV